MSYCICFKCRRDNILLDGRRLEIPLSPRRGRSILEMHLRVFRVGRMLECPCYAYQPLCGISWHTLSCILYLWHEFLYFLQGRSCNYVYNGNYVHFFAKNLYVWMTFVDSIYMDFHLCDLYACCLYLHLDFSCCLQFPNKELMPLIHMVEFKWHE